MKDSTPIKFGDVLRDLRTYHDYTQKDISDYLNITKQAYSNYERDERTPDLETIYKIAQFYHITLDQLISYCIVDNDQMQESGGYQVPNSIFRAGVSLDTTFIINAELAKINKIILSLPKERQDAFITLFTLLTETFI